MEFLRDRLFAIVEADRPTTVRGVFYQGTAQGVVAKTEKEYKGTVGRLLLQMRRSGRIPYDWITDNTRWTRKPTTYDSLEAAIHHLVKTYRRSAWSNQPACVEIWLEKDALASLFFDVTSRYDVPLLVMRGFPSDSYLHEAAQHIAARQRPTHIHYFGDRDPSGVHIDRDAEQKLREMVRKIDPDTEIYFDREAVLPEQIEAWNLPTRPTKQGGGLSKSFVGDSVELDAIPAPRLRQMIQDCIEQHIDRGRLSATQSAERTDRARLANWVEDYFE